MQMAVTLPNHRLSTDMLFRVVKVEFYYNRLSDRRVPETVGFHGQQPLRRLGRRRLGRRLPDFELGKRTNPDRTLEHRSARSSSN